MLKMGVRFHDECECIAIKLRSQRYSPNICQKLVPRVIFRKKKTKTYSFLEHIVFYLQLSATQTFQQYKTTKNHFMKA